MSDPDIQDVLKELKAQRDMLMHGMYSLQKSVDDVLWYHRLGEVAKIDKVRMTGPPPSKIPNPMAQGAGNPVVFWSYTFTPRDVEEGKRYPLLVFPHGGVHSSMVSSYAHIIGELLSQGYLVIAPEYRGSTGYGERLYKLIDYGGLEVEDSYAARNWMVENSQLVDPDRVGIMGWSHGGLHALLNIFEHPGAYQAAFAGVPVSDLVARMGYKTQRYRDMYSADYHIGKSAYEDVNEYRRRSPAWNAEKLETPLLIHTNTIDEDVNVLEVEHLIKALKAADKEFEYKIFEDAPGGHIFDRIDTRLAKEARLEIYGFLARYLKPPKPLSNLP
ncbi:MAG TPA: prolyl oligopeptidase family serine peptidase [Patescibacteria group bacterium]|nr:prolyl oligopeptidase family serine peptidase [Patescibacteria group bacterium]